MSTLICFALKEEAAPFHKVAARHPGVITLTTGIGRANAEKSMREFLAGGTSVPASREHAASGQARLAGTLAPPARNSRMDFSAFARPMPVVSVMTPGCRAATLRNGAASSFRAKQMSVGMNQRLGIRFSPFLLKENYSICVGAFLQIVNAPTM
jgi:hypothetical protein